MTPKTIRTAAVVGAGTIGAGVAAQLADAGADVVLLDLDAARAAEGVERQRRNGGFADPAAAARIRTGSTATDLALLAGADWIVEAAAERIEVKRALFAAIDAVRAPGSVISSSTSTLRLSALTEGMSEGFARDFLVTHFFNPPHRMRLLEMVTGPRTEPAAARLVRAFAEQRLGKVIVDARDTPGFIANRIGNFWMAAALGEAIGRGLAVEEADAVVGRPFGMPAGVFAFLDIVGIDLLPVGWAGLAATLAADDPLQRYLRPPPLVQRLVAEGRTGRKAGAGFTRRSAAGDEVVDLVTGAYRPAVAVAPAALAGDAADMRAIIARDSEGGRYADSVMCGTLAYAASLVPNVAETPDLADLAMRFGYGWKLGPFELIDRLGADWLAHRLRGSGRPVPPLLDAMAGARR